MTYLESQGNPYSETLILTPYPSQIFTSSLCEIELFAVRLPDPRAQNVKTVFFYLWPDLDLIPDLDLKMLSMD